MSLDRWCYPRGLIDPPVAVEFAGAPLRLYERGVWIPGDEYWGEPGDVLRRVLEVVCAGAEVLTCIAGDGAPLDAGAVEALVPEGVELDHHEGGQPSWWWLLAAE